MMDNLGLWIYLSDVVNSVSVVLTIIVILLLIGLAVLLCVVGGLYINDDLNEESTPRFYKIFRLLLVPLLILAPINCLIPSQKTIAAMIVVPAIVNNEDIKGITGDSLKGLRILSASQPPEYASPSGSPQ